MESKRVMKRDLTECMDFARDAARKAGDIALEYFQSEVAVEAKGDGSPVTIADRRAEKELRALIGRQYPTDAILGEEFGDQPGSSGWRWILDPIDGTQSFIHGVPLFGVLIGLEYQAEAVLGVVYLPGLDEWVYAARGHGCWWLPTNRGTDSSPRRASVSSKPALSEGLTLITGYEYFAMSGHASVLDRLLNAGRTRGWGDCYAHVLVATGRADAAVEPLMHVWDNAPLLPILLEAGGDFTDWKGNRTIAGGNAISSNGKVHAELLRLVQE